MTSSQIRVTTKGFRAIGEADIVINGITVVAGENGCGKSTLSKLLYYLYKTVSNYENLVSKELVAKLENVERLLAIATMEVPSLSSDKQHRIEARNEIRRELSNLGRISQLPLRDQLGIWQSIIHKTSRLFIVQPNQPNLFSDERTQKGIRSSRLTYIIKDILKGETFEETGEIQIPFGKILEFVENIFKEAQEKVDTRPTSLFIEALSRVFSSDHLPDVFDVEEFGEQIVSLKNESLSIPYSIQRAIYIDTPMMVGVTDLNNSHWNDLNILLAKRGPLSISEVSRTISQDVIHGEVSLDETSDYTKNFTYKREDGITFDLLNCATGIKSFAILQLLIKNESLDDKTILIIDEPESNLHPQWIIEYARLIVMMHKKLGTKFFIASHNPDMVSAIRYISEKEEVLSNVNFYLATKQDNAFLYNYKALGTEIDPIFASFNIAIDRINQYGS